MMLVLMNMVMIIASRKRQLQRSLFTKLLSRSADPDQNRTSYQFSRNLRTNCQLLYVKVFVFIRRKQIQAYHKFSRTMETETIKLIFEPGSSQDQS